MLKINLAHNFDGRKQAVRTMRHVSETLQRALDTTQLKPEPAYGLLESLPVVAEQCRLALEEGFFDSPYETDIGRPGNWTPNLSEPDPYETLMTLLPTAAHLVEQCRRRVQGHSPAWLEPMAAFASVLDEHTLTFCQLADFRALRRFEAEHAHWVEARSAYTTVVPNGQDWRAAGSPPWAVATPEKALSRSNDPAEYNGFVAFRGVASVLRNLKLTPIWEVDIPEYGVNSIYGDSCLVDKMRKLRRAWWNPQRAVMFARDLVEDRLREFGDAESRSTVEAVTEFLRTNPTRDARHLIPDDFHRFGGPYTLPHYAVLQLGQISAEVNDFGCARSGAYDPVRLLTQRFRIEAMRQGKDAYRDELDNQCARLSGCL